MQSLPDERLCFFVSYLFLVGGKGWDAIRRGVCLGVAQFIGDFQEKIVPQDRRHLE
jgi:hypothetical protein